MARKRMTKKEEGSILMRGGQRIELVKRNNQFTAFLRSGVDPETKSAFESADRKRALSDQMGIYEVRPSDLNKVMNDARKDKDVLFCHHVYAAAEDPDSNIILTDQIIVQFKEDVSPEQIAQMLGKYHLEIVEEYTDRANNFLLRVTADSGANPVKISNRLHSEGLTEYAEPNLVVQYKKYFEPADAKYAKQWHLKNRGGVELVAGADVNAPEAWDITTGSRSVIVAIIDDGFDLDHPDLQGPGKIVAPIDFSFRSPPTYLNPDPEVISDDRPYPEGSDYHGTPCAGVAVAEIGGGEAVGIAPDCSLMPIRWPFYGTDSMVSAMFRHAYQSGAAVISCSWGPGPGVHYINSKFSQVLHDTATLGRGGKGCVILFAAGNDNTPINDTIDGTRHFNGEAAHPDVMAIAACTSLNRKSAYSGWGREISVCAPSNNFWPGDVSRKLPGRGIVTIDNGMYGSGFDPGLYTERFGGTSSATPLVAGVAALVIAANPTLTAAQVRDILETTADKIEDHEPDPQLGLTKGTYDADGHSDWFGYGKVNAGKAVRMALGGIKTLEIRQVANLPIPDNDPAGVVSRIVVAEDARIQSLEVTVDILHPYIGDLMIYLVAPDGRRVVLHSREGGRTENLLATFDAATIPELGDLGGISVRGVWSLEVADYARFDEGVLRQWTLAAAIEDDGSIWVESHPSQQIPDNEPNGISDRIMISQSRNISQIDVELDITHTWIGDLRVMLTGPSGENAMLHDRSGTSAVNIQRVFDVSSAPDLNRFLNQDARGEWTLSVSDHAGRDTGKLNRWAIRIR